MINVDLKDKIILDENFKGTIITGRMEVEDKFGNIVLQKHNLVVLQGRGFVLKKLFNHPDIAVLSGHSQILGSENSDIAVSTRTIPVLFAVGNGGTNGVESPTTFVPTFNDKTIKSLFQDGVDILSDGVMKGKKFASISYVNDNSTNEAYIVMSLALSGADFGNNSVTINEAGILFGEATVTGADITSVTDLKLLSRLTFDGIPINSGDSFTIRYYLYA